MTDTALAVWDPNSGAALPAYLADAMGELGSNIVDRGSVPSLSYEGKTWTIVKDGNKTKLQAANSDGDMVPVPVMRVVILNYNPDRGRAFYQGVYNPAAASAPTCWSADGKAPDPSVKEKQSSLCQGCPQSVKGSKVQDGKEMVACSSHRMIAIAPAFDMAADPLRLKIAVTSDYDKEIVEHGWFAFRQYGDYLKSRGIAHTALVVTKIKFDSNTAYPKLLFAIDRPVTADELTTIKGALANPKVAELLAEKWTAGGVNGKLTDESDIRPHGLEGAYADGWQAHPDSAGWSWKGEEVIENDALAARYPAPTPPAIPAKEEAKAPAIPAKDQIVEHVPATPPPAAVHDPAAAATANGWAVHPENAEYWYKDADVLPVADVMAKYPAPVAAAPAAAPAAPPAPPAAPPAPAKPAHDPIAAATADGWAVHPENDAFMYKGEQVIPVADVKAMYLGNGASTATSAAAPATAGTGQAATPAASPSSGEVPAEVQGLLDKWT